MKLRTVTATRYVTPLKEGGSLPAIIEADDEGMYVLKFRGAGQGPKALIAELIAGELARAAKLPVPELVFIELHPELARTEPDPEIQSLIAASAGLLRSSTGLNIGLDYLPGSVTFDPLTAQPAPALASAIVWFDAYTSNVDRTARNTNMLMWHRQLQLIDHGAALYFHHDWGNYLERVSDPFTAIKQHVLLKFASEIDKVDAIMSSLLTEQVIRDVVALVPDTWLAGDDTFGTPEAFRAAYIEYLLRRMTAPRAFVEEAIRARSLLV